MNSLLFVESPLQLLNAYEAIKKFELEKYFIVIRLSNIEQNDKQLIYLSNMLSLKNIKYIKINSQNKTILDYLYILIYRFKYRFSNIDKVFIGNYESNFFKLILKQFNRNQIILMDDGAKSIDIQKSFDNKYNYNLFTMYDLHPYKNQLITKNNYDRIQEKLQTLQIDDNIIIFIGSKLSELNIIKEEYYIELLKKISNLYSTKKIIYISHREENYKKLQKIKDKFKFDIIQLDYPVELYGLYHKEIPHKVVSFYSTALFTMKKIYQIEVESFKFDYKDSKYKNIIDNTYNYYSNYIKVSKL